MSPLSRPIAILAAAFMTLALAGCGPKSDGAGTKSTPDAMADPVTTADSTAPANDSASGGTCPAVAQEGYDLFSTDQVVTAPVDGAIYGDGTPISWTFAGPTDGTPDVDISYVNNAGDAIPIGGIFLEDMGDNTWGSTLNVFNSDADGRPAFMRLGLTHDVTDDGTGKLSGTHEIVGIYCVTLKLAP